MKKQQKGVLIAISIFGLLMLINGIRYKLVFSRRFTDIDSAGASVSVGKAADCTVTWSIGPFDSDIDYFKRSDRYIQYYLSETVNGNLICVRSTNPYLYQLSKICYGEDQDLDVSNSTKRQIEISGIVKKLPDEKVSNLKSYLETYNKKAKNKIDINNLPVYYVKSISQYKVNVDMIFGLVILLASSAFLFYPYIRKEN